MTWKTKKNEKNEMEWFKAYTYKGLVITKITIFIIHILKEPIIISQKRT
jgi:hypothetical protein